MGGLSTHVLDTAAGRPAPGMAVTLERRSADGSWTEVGSAVTDPDGRVADLLGGEELAAGDHRIRFATGAYGNPFYPEVTVVFTVSDPGEHHHVPLLLSRFGYSTYRGS